MLLLLSIVTGGCTGLPEGVQPVDGFEIDKYLGKWYEIASYPAWFQRNCTAVTADYSLREDGLIEVVNSCRKDTLDGKLKQAKGRILAEPLVSPRNIPEFDNVAVDGDVRLR